MAGKKQVVQPKFTSAQLEEVLLFVEDTFDRAVMPFLVVGTTGKCVLEDRYLEGEGIELMVRSRDYSHFARETIKLLLPDAVMTDNQITFSYKGVPVTVTIVYKLYPFLKNPETRFYGIANFLLPNPFQEYWKVRALFK